MIWLDLNQRIVYLQITPLTVHPSQFGWSKPFLTLYPFTILLWDFKCVFHLTSYIHSYIFKKLFLISPSFTNSPPLQFYQSSVRNHLPFGRFFRFGGSPHLPTPFLYNFINPPYGITSLLGDFSVLEDPLIYQLPSFTILSILRTESPPFWEIFPFWE